MKENDEFAADIKHSDYLLPNLFQGSYRATKTTGI